MHEQQRERELENARRIGATLDALDEVVWSTSVDGSQVLSLQRRRPAPVRLSGGSSFRARARPLAAAHPARGPAGGGWRPLARRRGDRGRRTSNTGSCAATARCGACATACA
ncbi:MAG: hypothetical protein MZV70_53725 [Desulfobacterales bacterium]|nr:hypothetical protein [Desulfobacterales bacterium]